jgi:hypothetical protein
MPPLTPIASVVFSAPISLGISLAMVVAIVAIAVARRIAVGSVAGFCLSLGIVLLAISAGQPLFNRMDRPSIVVMVDLSPSTRGATYRDRAALDLRLHQLLGNQPCQLLAFADQNQPMPAGNTLDDIPSDQTRFAPPDADAIVLLSDGQFALPAYAPPTFAVIDPALEQITDAAVVNLHPVDHQVLARVRNTNVASKLRWIGATPDSSGLLATPTDEGEITASLPGGDLWPENDSLTLIPSPPPKKQKWWIGENAPPGWRGFSPSSLSANASDYLEPSVIVLNDISADTLSSNQQARLLQYVQELGGSVVLVGGPDAFAAGHYENTPLDALSPLASAPPQPTLQWMLLIDSSGSMAGDPWRTEVTAISRLLPQLPPADPVNVGSFAESLKWWSTGKAATATARLSLPPMNLSVNGPTNLYATLVQIADASDGAMPSQLLLMTDADADLPGPTELATALRAKKIHLHLLAIAGASVDRLCYRRVSDPATRSAAVGQQRDAPVAVGAAGSLPAWVDSSDTTATGFCSPVEPNLAEGKCRPASKR